MPNLATRITAQTLKVKLANTKIVWVTISWHSMFCLHLFARFCVFLKAISWSILCIFKRDLAEDTVNFVQYSTDAFLTTLL